MKENIENLMILVSSIMERGAVLTFIGEKISDTEESPIIDHLVIEKTSQGFILGYRPIGITHCYESGAFEVQSARFSLIGDFKIEEDRILFYEVSSGEERRILSLSPITPPLEEKWEEWKNFKSRHRDLFESLDLNMLEMLRHLKKG